MSPNNFGFCVHTYSHPALATIRKNGVFPSFCQLFFKSKQSKIVKINFFWAISLTILMNRSKSRWKELQFGIRYVKFQHVWSFLVGDADTHALDLNKNFKWFHVKITVFALPCVKSIAYKRVPSRIFRLNVQILKSLYLSVTPIKSLQSLPITSKFSSNGTVLIADPRCECKTLLFNAFPFKNTIYREILHIFLMLLWFWNACKIDL